MKKFLMFALSLILVFQGVFAGVILVSAEDVDPIAENSVQAEIPESIKILAIGNSFSQDATQWMYNILTDLGVKEVVVGNLYIAGCSLKTHASKAVDGSDAYTYYKGNAETEGVMTAASDKKSLLYGLQDEDWDYISFQEASPTSGVSTAYEPYLTELIEFINANKTNPDAKLMWHMTWAYQGTSTHENFPTYGKNQDIMYKSIIKATQKAVLPHEEISIIIPAGTALQNMRTSTIGDNLTRDGYHLSNGLGRYAAGVMWAKSILGADLSELKTMPENTNPITDEELEILIECVGNAYKNPFEITQSEFVTPEILAERESKKPFEIVVATELGTFDEETKTFTFNNGASVPNGANVVYLPDAAIGADWGACCYVDGDFYAPRNIVDVMSGKTPYEKFSGKLADCTLETKSENGKMMATLIIKNNLKDESLRGIVRFKNEEITSAVGDVEIAPVSGGETTRTTVEIPFEYTGAYGIDLSYDFITQYGTYPCNTVRHYIFVDKADEVKIDGIISEGEWGNATKLVLDEQSTVGMKDWTGPDDLSAVAYVAYDSKSLYIAAEVIDDVFKPYSHRSWLNGDSVQFDLYIDENGHFEPGIYDTFTEIGLGLANKIPGVHRYRTNTGKLERGMIDNAQIVITRDGNKMTYEMIADWKDFFGVEFTPTADNALGFTFLVNENDGVSGEGWLKFAEGAGGNEKRDANKFAQMYFLGTEKEDPANDGSFVEDGVKYILFRRVFANSGAEVSWDDSLKTAQAIKDGKTVTATVGATEITVNGEVKPISGEIKLINCRTYIPELDITGLFN